ncbi:MAG: VCBS repeat-containing protein [Candidatus Eisenbacteria bacterium]
MSSERPPLDPPALDWLLAGVREAMAAEPEPLYHLYLWVEFLELLLERSVVDSPLYLLEVRDGLAALDGKPLPLFDSTFLRRLRGLADHPRLMTERVRDVGSEVAARLRAFPLATHAQLEPRGRDGSARASVLLVWHRDGITGVDVTFGFPLTLGIRANRRRRASPEIRWEGVSAASVPFEETAATARAAACSVVGVDRAALDYHLLLERRNGGLEGRSLGLPLAVTLLAFENLARRREARWIRPDALLTGEIRADGSIIGVDAACLRHKVRAAQVAGFRAMGLPAESLDAATEEAAMLAALDPDRPPPKLIPLSHLREAAVHPELVFALPRGKRPGIESHARRWWFALATLAVLGAVYWNIANPWTDRAQPDRSFERSADVRLKQAGFPPRGRVFHYESPIGDRMHAIQVVALEPDQRPALLVGTGTDGDRPCCLYLDDIRSGRRLWSRDLSHRLPLPAATYEGNRFWIQEVSAIDLDGDHRTDIVAKIQAIPNSPCAFLWFDADGNERGMFGHRGYIWYPVPCDYDHDGLPELFAFGTLNTDDEPYNQSATVVVLNARHWNGWPGEGPFEGSFVAPYDSSWARIIFPPIPEHCAVVGQPGYIIEDTDLSVSSSPRPSRLVVCIHPIDGAGLVVTFDEDLNVTRVIAQDSLKPLVAQWLAEGELRVNFISSESLAAYGKRIVVKRAGR